MCKCYELHAIVMKIIYAGELNMTYDHPVLSGFNLNSSSLS